MARVSFLPALLLVCGLLGAPMLQAETSKGFQVGATVKAGCLINNQAPADGAALGALNFGTDSALSTAQKSAAFVGRAGLVLSCTPNVALTMRVNGGLHYDAGRRLQRQGGAQTLAYTLYSDSASQNSLGVNQTIAVNTAATPSDIRLVLAARLVLPGNLPAGSYADTLTLTLEW